MLCSELLIRFLAENGVDHIFGIPGYANSAIFLSTLGYPSVKPVLTKHEANAGWLAYGYAQASGKFGVCTGTSGAGTTNIISSIAAAYYNSIPVLVLTGQVEKSKFGKGAFQELTGSGPRSVCAMKLFDNVTKYSAMVTDPNDLPRVLTEAKTALTTGRLGPVHINLPIDIQKKEVETIWHNAPQELPPEIGIDEIAAALDMLCSAQAPMVLFGRGCQRAQSEAIQLLDTLNIPYATTLQGRGIVPENRANFLGVVGVAGSPRCHAYVAEQCDLILAVGTSLGEFTTNGYDESFTKPHRLIHVDIDEREFGKTVAPRLAIKSDAATFCRTIATKMPSLISAARTYPAPQQPLEVPIERNHDVPDQIAPFEIMEVLAEVAPDQTTFLADSGNNAVWAAHYLRLKPTQQFMIDINTGCMGSGVASALGVKFARPDRTVISICGDGGFMMNGIEVATAADHKIPVVWLVMNDFKLGMVNQGDRAKYGTSVAYAFENCDIAAMAASYGADSRVIHSKEELRAALNQVAALQHPLVLDVRFNDKYLPTVYARVKKKAEDHHLASATKDALKA